MPTLILKAHDTDDGSEELIVVDKSPFLVGRRPENDAQIFQPDVSGQHAELQFHDQNWVVVDKASTNGTFLNGRRVEGSASLASGDILHFATRSFLISRETEPEEENGQRKNSTIVADPKDIKGMVNLVKIIGEQRTFPHFQRIVDLSNGETLGWESLGRGVAAEGMIPPGSLFRLAAVSRVESKLSMRFRQSACKCLACGHCWPSDKKYQLWVNLHPAELHDDRFLPSLQDMSQSGLGHAYQVVIEMPESWVCNTDQMEVLVAKVRDLGFLVAYDDFGAGQSRIPDLITVPPDYVKLDRQLVANIGDNKVKHDLVQAIVNACNELNVQTLGEGIETQEERDACIEMGIRYGQGYFLGRPKSPFDLFDQDIERLPNDCVFVRLGMANRQ
ncbi:EAL domain-containing protein [Kolteria novifilia]|uniref:EAL domain-containing protein n=1 Tax=Kolteria novifilia TaxID=2527975 RepID=UPI003AF37A65